MVDSTTLLEELVARLGFRAVELNKACGEIGGLPATLTAVSDQPLALLVQFRIRNAAPDLQPAIDLLASSSSETFTISFSPHTAWLSLYELAGHTPDSIGAMVQQFAESLAAAGLSPDSGCLRCGNRVSAEIVHVEGVTSRLCRSCLELALEDRARRQAELDRPRVLAVLGLPAVILICAAGWAIFWTLWDVFFHWMRIEVIEINRLTTLIFLVVTAAIGALLGIPLGTALRKSGAVSAAPKALSVAVVLGIIAGGEVLYAAILLFRVVGLFDFNAAVRLLPFFVQLYGAFDLICKIGVALLMTIFCVITVQERRVAALDI